MERSTVGFAIKHLTVATVRGSFARFDGWLDVDESGVVAGGGTVESASVNAGDTRRDAVLLEPGFFDAARYPVMSLATTEIDQRGREVTIEADLTMKGITRPVSLAGTVERLDPEAAPLRCARILAAGTISRAEFGVTGGGVFESHGAVVSDTVKLELDVTVVRQPEDE